MRKRGSGESDGRARKRPIHRLLVGTAALLALAGSAGPAGALPPNHWLQYNVLARESLLIGGALILNGNYAAFEDGSTLRIESFTTQLNNTPPFVVAGFESRIANGVTVGDVFADHIVGGLGGVTVTGTLTLGFDFPLMIIGPQGQMLGLNPIQLPSQVFAACTGANNLGDVRIPSQAATLQPLPKCYDNVILENSGHLVLAPGGYKMNTFRSFGRTGNNPPAMVMSDGTGPVDIYVTDQWFSERITWTLPMGPADDVTDLQIWAGGTGGNRIGQDNFFKGTFYAPNDGTLRIAQGTVAEGTIYAKGIEIRGFHAGPPVTPTPTPTPPGQTPTPTPPGQTPTPTPPGQTPTPTPPGQTPTPTPPGQTPTPTGGPTPTPTLPVIIPTPTPTPPGQTPTPTPPGQTPTPTPPGQTPTPTPPGQPTPTPTLPVNVPTPTPQITTTPAVTPTQPVNPPGPRKKLWGRGKFNPGWWPPMGPRQHNRPPNMKRPVPKVKMMKR